MKSKNTLLVAGALFVSLASGCERSTHVSAETEQQIKIIAKEAVENLVFVPGGSFKLGYAASDTVTTLDDFYMSRYTATAGDMFYYMQLHNIDPVTEYTSSVGMKIFLESMKIPYLPARANWEQASGYCAWLGEITGLKFSLPTDAQWEYAARSAGQNTNYATDSGYVDDFNAPLGAKSRLHNRWYGINSAREHYLPDDYYPPNPLGFYGMINNGPEWVMDWYAPDEISAGYVTGRNPTGPEQPYYTDASNQYLYHAKATRSGSNSRPTSVYSRNGSSHMRDHYIIRVRCVVNQPDLKLYQ